MLHLLLESLRFSLLASQDTDEESETVEPQSRISNRSTVLQSEENPQTSRKKTKAEVEKPNDPPVAKKHNSMDSVEDDEEPQNEPGTSSLPLNLLYQCYLLNQGPAASSQGPAASANADDENSEYSDEQWCTKSGLWKDSSLPRSIGQ